MLEDLAAAGILTGSVDDMMAVNLGGRVFQVLGSTVYSVIPH